MRGGAFLKGKEGRVGFRRSLKVQGRTGGFSKKKTYNPLAFTQKTLIFAQN